MIDWKLIEKWKVLLHGVLEHDSYALHFNSQCFPASISSSLQELSSFYGIFSLLWTRVSQLPSFCISFFLCNPITLVVPRARYLLSYRSLAWILRQVFNFKLPTAARLWVKISFVWLERCYFTYYFYSRVLCTRVDRCLEHISHRYKNCTPTRAILTRAFGMPKVLKMKYMSQS